jgi:hypothetical protein
MTKPSEMDPTDDLALLTKSAPRVEISTAIHKHCTRGLEPCRGRSAEHRMLLSLAACFAMLAGLLALTYGAHRDDETFHSALIGAAGWGIVQTLVLWFGFAKPPGKRMSTGARVALVLLVPVAFAAYVALAAPEWVSFGQFISPAGLERVGGCGVVSLLVGAVASGSVLMLWRGTDPLTPGLSGALAGLVGGIGGGVAIGAACPTQEGWHSVVAHGLGVLLFVTFGWLVGRRLLAP